MGEAEGAAGGSVSVHVDTRDYLSFAKALREAMPIGARELNRGLRAAGQIVATAAKAFAAYSQSIPPSIKVRLSKGTVTVVAGGNGIPVAALEELSKGQWRHPVFGNRNVWVSQVAYPFLQPAVQSNLAAVDAAAQAALDLSVERAIL